MKRLFLVTALLFATPAFAGTAMPLPGTTVQASTIDFSQLIHDEKGNPMLVNPDKKDEGQVTLKFIAVRALSQPFDDERSLAPEKKFYRGELAHKINEATQPLSLTAENIVEIKLVVGKAFPAWVVAEAWPMLDGALKPAK